MGTASLRPDGRSLSFVPRTLLPYDAEISFTVSASIADFTGAQLTGARNFGLSTLIQPPRPPGGARLTDACAAHHTHNEGVAGHKSWHAGGALGGVEAQRYLGRVVGGAG